MNLFARAFAFVITAGAIACTVNSTTSGSSGSSGSPTGATADQLNRCHAGCDKMKFFNCSSADQLSQCYSDCGAAQPAAIDVFIACAENSICDPACRTKITPPPSSGSSSGSGGGTTSGGGCVSASSCQSACTKLITTCNLAPVGQMQACVDACQKEGYQYQIDCINNNACGDIVSRCGSSTGGSSGSTSGGTSSGGTSTSGGPTDAGTTDPNVFRCQSDCDMLLSRTCIDATMQSTCRNDCTTITGAKRDTFMSCAESSPDCTGGTDCYNVFSAP